MIAVTVSNFVGDKLDFELKPDARVSSVKESVASQWKVPCSCQHLLTHASVLNDTDSLVSCCNGGMASLALTLVLSLRAICNELGSGAGKRQVSALSDICRLGVKAGEAAITLVSAHLEDINVDVRRKAVEALYHIADKGNVQAVALVSELLSDPDYMVRQAAVAVLAKLTEPWDQRTISLVSARLEDEYFCVRWTAVEALVQVVGKGCRSAIDVCATRLKHKDKDVRREAVHMLQHLAEKGDRHAIAAVAAHLEDKRSSVRKDAMEALHALEAKRGAWGSIEQDSGARHCKHRRRTLRWQPVQ